VASSLSQTCGAQGITGPIFRRLLDDIESAVDHVDFQQEPGEFTGLFWLITSFLDSLEPVARAQMVDRDTVQRWKRGVVPPAFRRRGALKSALDALKAENEVDPKPPFVLGHSPRRKSAKPLRVVAATDP
jgi:hypothetical protein